MDYFQYKIESNTKRVHTTDKPKFVHISIHSKSVLF